MPNSARNMVEMDIPSAVGAVERDVTVVLSPKEWENGRGLMATVDGREATWTPLADEGIRETLLPSG